MNGPTILTVTRVLLIPFIIIFNYMGSPWQTWFTAAVFLIASITDWLDGYLARRNNQVTTLGKLLDPLADKLLVLSAFLVILDRGHIPAWIAVIMIGREMAITGLRAFLAAENIVLDSSRLGKWKMGFQVAALSLLFVAAEWPWFYTLGLVTLYIALAFALLSAYFYLAHFWAHLGEKILEEQNRGRIE
jgi:CDP-diacylglycerol--glycerol-3-phosphate 3-phosphatidyltransferase